MPRLAMTCALAVLALQAMALAQATPHGKHGGLKPDNVVQARRRTAHLRQLAAPGSNSTAAAKVQAYRMTLVKWLCAQRHGTTSQALFPCMFARHLKKNRGLRSPAERRADNDQWAAWLKQNKAKQLSDFWSMFDRCARA